MTTIAHTHPIADSAPTTASSPARPNRHLAKGVTWLTASEILGKASALGRTVLFARMLGAESFGVGATIWLSLAFLDMISNSNVDKLLIQAPESRLDALQRTSHTLQAIRGLGVALVLAALAIPMSRWLGAPQAAAAFAAVALVPIIRGLSHLDAVRAQRHYNYTASCFSEAVGQIGALVLAIPLAILFRSYWAMVIVAIAQVVISAALTHLMAKTPYRWGWCGESAKAISGFGWPLLINGVLMWVILQGDQMLVALWRTPKDVGLYDAAFGFALGPTLIAARVLTGLLLPRFSAVQAQSHKLAAQVQQASRLSAGAVVLLGVPVTLLSPFIMAGVYGPDFAPATDALALLILMQSIRILRIVPALAAMSRGDTVNLMISNLTRIAFSPLAIYMAATGRSLAAIAAAATVAEVAAWAVASWRLDVKHGISWRKHSPQSLIAMALVLATALAVALHSSTLSVLIVVVSLLVTPLLASGAVSNVSENAGFLNRIKLSWHAVYYYISTRTSRVAA